MTDEEIIRRAQAIHLLKVLDGYSFGEAFEVPLNEGGAPITIRCSLASEAPWEQVVADRIFRPLLGEALTRYRMALRLIADGKYEESP